MSKRKVFFRSLRCGKNEGQKRKTEELAAKASGKDEHTRWMIDVRGWFGRHVSPSFYLQYSCTRSLLACHNKVIDAIGFTQLPSRMKANPRYIVICYYIATHVMWYCISTMSYLPIVEFISCLWLMCTDWVCGNFICGFNRKCVT